jgi:hypothetical protein
VVDWRPSNDLASEKEIGVFSTVLEIRLVFNIDSPTSVTSDPSFSIQFFQQSLIIMDRDKAGPLSNGCI